VLLLAQGLSVVELQAVNAGDEHLVEPLLAMREVRRILRLTEFNSLTAFCSQERRFYFGHANVCHQLFEIATPVRPVIGASLLTIMWDLIVTLDMVGAGKTMSHAADVEVVATHEVDGVLRAIDRIAGSRSMPISTSESFQFYQHVLIFRAVSMSSKPINHGELPLAKPNSKTNKLGKPSQKPKKRTRVQQEVGTLEALPFLMTKTPTALLQ
jgi:hypothetical protein